jgi:hypothetical protein
VTPSRRWPRTSLPALVYLVLFVGACTTSEPAVTTAATSPPSATSSAEPIDSSSPISLPTTPKLTMELTFKVAKAYQVLRSPDHHSLYVLSGGGLSVNNAPLAGRILRLDPASGVIARSPYLQGASNLAFARGRLWVSCRTRAGPAGLEVLYQLDPDSLWIVSRIRSPFGSVVGSPSALWAADRNHVAELDPITGSRMRTLKIGGLIEGLAHEPEGNRLYVATGKAGGGTRAIEELDGGTGRVIATRSMLGGVFWSSLSATRTGVWTSYSSGMMGAVQFYDAAGLKPKRRGFQTGTNSITAGVMDGRAWIVDQNGNWMGCDTHKTGRLLSVWRMPASVGFLSSGVVTIGSLAYVAASKGIWSFNPAGPCGLAHRFPPFQP